MTHEGILVPVSAEMPSNAQRLFARYFTAILIDLTVLNLFDEYSDKVSVDTFTTSLFAALLLQVLLKATLAVEHWAAAYCNPSKAILEIPAFPERLADPVRFQVRHPRGNQLYVWRQGQVCGGTARPDHPDRRGRGDALGRGARRALLSSAGIGGGDPTNRNSFREGTSGSRPGIVTTRIHVSDVKQHPSRGAARRVTCFPPVTLNNINIYKENLLMKTRILWASVLLALGGAACAQEDADRRSRTPPCSTTSSNPARRTSTSTATR